MGFTMEKLGVPAWPPALAVNMMLEDTLNFQLSKGP